MKFLNDFVVVAGSGPCTHIYIQLALISKKTSEVRVSFLRVRLSLLSLSSKVYMVQKKMACILYKYDQVLASRVTKPFEQSTFGKMSRSQKILSTYFPKNLLPNLAVGVFSAKN